MAVAFLIEIPGMTQEQGAAVIRELSAEMGLAEGKSPAGQILHIEGPMEGGLRVVDVWESQEAFNAFVGARLMPLLQKLGVAVPPDFAPKAVWPVSALLTK
ncbi:MAG TPA: hypothetical protein VKQ36_01090 [Ktedonobacterales bacterium]|nr:hypothetical protein [Ktedonobacterales bacterium]